MQNTVHPCSAEAEATSSYFGQGGKGLVSKPGGKCSDSCWLQAQMHNGTMTDTCRLGDKCDDELDALCCSIASWGHMGQVLACGSDTSESRTDLWQQRAGCMHAWTCHARRGNLLS